MITKLLEVMLGLCLNKDIRTTGIPQTQLYSLISDIGLLTSFLTFRCQLKEPRRSSSTEPRSITHLHHVLLVSLLDQSPGLVFKMPDGLIRDFHPGDRHLCRLLMADTLRRSVFEARHSEIKGWRFNVHQRQQQEPQDDTFKWKKPPKEQF